MEHCWWWCVHSLFVKGSTQLIGLHSKSPHKVASKRKRGEGAFLSAGGHLELFIMTRTVHSMWAGRTNLIRSLLSSPPTWKEAAKKSNNIIHHILTCAFPSTLLAILPFFSRLGRLLLHSSLHTAFSNTEEEKMHKAEMQTWAAGILQLPLQ